MYVFRDLDQAFKRAKRLPLTDQSKIVLMSDCHRGDGSGADNFRINQNIYSTALQYYYQNGYTYIELGDGDEMWENSNFSRISQVNGDVFDTISKFYSAGRFHMIYGNHDLVKKNKKWVRRNMTDYMHEYSKKRLLLFPDIEIDEGILLEDKTAQKRILLVHGHQVDYLNNQLWKLSRFLVRHVWRPFEIIGMKNPWSPRNNYKRKTEIEKLLSQWSDSHSQMLIAGHTHRTAFPDIGEPLYFNDGCCVYPGFITAIEIENSKIALVKWTVYARDDGVLFVDRQVLKGPVKLAEYLRTTE